MRSIGIGTLAGTRGEVDIVLAQGKADDSNLNN